MLNFASKARPYFGAIIVTVALLAAGGIYSATRMPSAVFPEVTFPRIAVVARSAGLAVPNMEIQVTRPLEQAVSTVIGVVQVRSKTIRGGSELFIDFTPGTDMLRAEQFVWNRIGAARSALPANVDLTVDRMTPSISPIISLVLTGGNGMSGLRDYAFYDLAPRIKNIPDVLYANVAGGDIREIEVEVRPDDLLAAGISAADLADQIGKAHRLQPVGRSEQAPYAYELIVNGQGETARDIEDLVIATRNNQPLRVRDVADVKVWHQDRVLSIGYAGKDAVVVTVFRTIGGNTVNISNDLQELLKRQPGPSNIQRRIVYDQARFVSTAVHNVRDAIVVGGFFSILIVFAFLRSWRATFISVLAIPITLAITFWFLHWTGETLNLMSLGGLAVAIGLIIDDTVVVIENIARHLQKSEVRSPRSEGSRHESAGTEVNGPPPAREADPVDAASSEITGAVVGSTLTTVIVFVPLAFIVGVYGQFFASLSWALSIAVLVSMVISLTLIPVFASKFLAGKPMPPPGRFYRLFAENYDRILAGTLRHPLITVAISISAMVGIVLLLTGLPDPRPVPRDDKGKPTMARRPPLVRGIQTGLMPAMDEGAFVFDYWAPTGTPLEATVAMAREAEEVLLENPDVESFVRRTGTELGLFATQTNRGDIQVILRPAEDDPWSLLTKRVRPPFEAVEKEMKELGKRYAAEKYGPGFTPAQAQEEGKEAIRRKYRRRPIKAIMDEIEDGVKEHFAEHQFKFELVQIMQDELADLSGAAKPVEVKLFGPEYPVLRSLADQAGEILEKNGKGHGIKEVENHVTQGNPDVMIVPDGTKVTRYNTSALDIERQLGAMYLGQVATQVRESALRMTNVRVRYPDQLRFGTKSFDPDSLLNHWVLVPAVAAAVSGPAAAAAVTPLVGPAQAVALSEVTRLNLVRTPDEQWRENQQPVHFVTAAALNEEEAGLNTVVAEITDWMNTKINLPSGYRWEIGGYYLNQQAAFRSLTFVMVVAVVLIYIMLAFQFRSLVLPLLIFLEQPLSLASGLFALWITNTPLNVSSYMGAILLIGLDMKNGIILVEYIQQLRRQGMGLEEAIFEAGRARLRPILMTSLAAILGLLPLAFGIGPGAQMQQPLAIMVMGGLTANMLFARMVIRAGYLLLERNKGTLAPQPAKAPSVPVAPLKEVPV
jgi:multidrug efflux pump subunit AcrB